MDRLAYVIVLAGALTFASSARANTAIFRCEIGGVTTFSDRPCGEESTSYSPVADRVSTYEAPPEPKNQVRAAKKPKKRAARSSIAEAQRKHAEECRRIEASLRDIRSKQRSGYSAKEGERLRARLHTLNERRKANRCG